MVPCDRYQDRLLDHLYGLLDPSEVDKLEAHLAGCPACTSAHEQAGRWGGLIAQAARSEFPSVRFIPPVETTASVPTAPIPNPAWEPRKTVTRSILHWAVAAGLLIGVVGVGGRTARDLIGYLSLQPRVEREYAELRQADKRQKQLDNEVLKARREVAQRLATAEKTHRELIQEWAKVEARVVAEGKSRPLTIYLNGPTTAIPGAPNTYAIRTLGPDGKLRAVNVEAQVLDATGRSLFKTTFKTNTGTEQATKPGEIAHRELTLPASLWTDVKPGSELFLALTATDAETKETASTTERFRLLEPTYTTFLTTDKPMYRPGELVYFRSLTLDRATLLPPGRDLSLKYALLNAQGKSVPGLTLGSRPTPVSPDRLSPVPGPDGQPLRGVGTGAFTLPANLVGGTYTLTVTEGASAKPIASRRLIVNNFAPESLEKKLDFDARTYGPGDVVRVKVEVRDQGEPVAGIPLWTRIAVDGHEVEPDSASRKTNDIGTATIEFSLPESESIRSATLTVTVAAPDGTRETLVRPVPLASRTLDVEFFPEGGDLVLGVPNRVYFRASTTTAPIQPADVAGVLTDGTRTLCEVKTLTDADHPGVNQGLGAFTFTPEPGKRYVVKLDRPVGVVQPVSAPFASTLGIAAATLLSGYELPAAKADGVVLHIPDGVAKPGDKLKVNLWTVGKKRSVLVGAYTRGRPISHQRAVLEPGKPTELTLEPGDGRFGGVTRVTVFEEPGDEDGRINLKPVAERLVYRQQGEVLKLRFDATRPGGKPTNGAFAPGEPVELTVHAYDEAGRPKPAILWAAVVNQSVLAMAGDQSERMLPTHFLLSGEVRNGNELENADFLLTDHPKAATGLDLLLGTQGWRRFAEQAPGEFQARYGNQAEPVLVAMGQRTGDTPLWRSDARRVFEEYWPKYETAVNRLDSAEEDQQTGESLTGVLEERASARREYDVQFTQFLQPASDLQYFNKSIESRRPWLPVTLIVVLGSGVVLLVIRLLRKAGSPDRSPLTISGIGLLGLGLFMLFAFWLTGQGDRGWRFYAAALESRNPGVYTFQPGGGSSTVSDPAPPQTKLAKDQARTRKKGLRTTSVLPPAPPGLKPLPPRDDDEPQSLAPASVIRKPSPLAPRLRSDLFQLLEEARMAERPLTESERIGFGRIQASPALAPPMVVREYAHKHPTPDEATSPDEAETLLWQPVIVLPDDGTTKLHFDLSDAVNGYRVLIAGHTLDGRIGSVSGTIEVRKK